MVILIDSLQNRTPKKLFLFVLPLVLVLVSFILSAVDPKNGLFKTDQFHIISNIFFFNQAHILLTFFLIFSTDHFSSWRRNFRIYKVNFNVYLLLVFCLFYLFVLSFFFDVFGLGKKTSTILYFFMYQVYGTQHFLYQSFGFSSHITNGFMLSNSEDSKNINLVVGQLQDEKKNIFRLYFSFFCNATAGTFFRNNNWIYYPLIGVGCIAGAVSLACIYLSYKKITINQLRVKKRQFGVRYFLYPLKGLSPWLSFAAIIIHGWEYIYFVNSTITEGKTNGRLSIKKFGLFLALEVVFIIPLLFMNSPKLMKIFEFEKTTTYFIIAGFINAFILCHFFTDRLAFARSSNPEAHRSEFFKKLSLELYHS